MPTTPPAVKPINIRRYELDSMLVANYTAHEPVDGLYAVPEFGEEVKSSVYAGPELVEAIKTGRVHSWSTLQLCSRLPVRLSGLFSVPDMTGESDETTKKESVMDRTKREGAALKICEVCPVRRLCIAEAVLTDNADGNVHGLTTTQLKSQRRKYKKDGGQFFKLVLDYDNPAPGKKVPGQVNDRNLTAK